jgi:hypothetical protein
VRRHAVRYRYDTALELQLLHELYALVRIRFNMFTATKKAIGWRENRTQNPHLRQAPDPLPAGHRLRCAHTRESPELAALFNATNPADRTRGITAIQLQLISLAVEKTQAMRPPPREQNT